MYGGLVVGYETCCTTSGRYHGINICESNVSHPKYATSILDGGFPNGSLLDELPPSEFPGCPPSNGWWLERVAT